MAKQENYIKTQVRLPIDLHARIQLAAEKSGRSMNAEIVERLWCALNGEALGMSPDVATMLEVLVTTAATLTAVPDRSVMSKEDRDLFDRFDLVNEEMAKRVHGAHFELK